MPLHGLRHTFGTVMVRRVPLGVLQKLMGHADVATTMRYVDVSEDDKARGYRGGLRRVWATGGRQRIRYARGVPQATARVDRSPSVPPEMIARIVEVLHPEQVWLFGSRARGEARDDSDWDFMAILANNAPEQDLDLASVWPRLRDLRLRRVEVFTMTREEFDEWKHSLGTLAEIVASTGVVVYGG